MFNTRGGGGKYGILFIFRLFYEYRNLEYGGIYGMYRVKPGGIRYSHSCGGVTGIREYVFTM